MKTWKKKTEDRQPYFHETSKIHLFLRGKAVERLLNVYGVIPLDPGT